MKKRNKLIVIFIFAIFFISLVSSSNGIGCVNGWQGFAKLHENKVVSISCPTCNFINISATNPSGELFINNVPMIKNGSRFIYDFSGTDLNSLGYVFIDGASQLDDPLGLCFEITITGKELSIGAYVISIIFILLLFIGVVFLNKKFDYNEREKLYKQIVVEYFKFKDTKNKGNMAYALLFTIAYAILKMIFVLYYLVVLLFLFIFNELIQAYSINTFASLMPQILVISLYLLTILGFIFVAVLFEVIRSLMKQIGLMLRGVED